MLMKPPSTLFVALAGEYEPNSVCREMRFRLVLGALIGVLAFAAAGCVGSGNGGGDAKGRKDVSGSISIMAIWAGEEQKSFQAVIDGFNESYPNVKVEYTSGGDNGASLHRRRRRQSARHRGGRTARPDGGLREDRRDQADRQPAGQVVAAFGEAVADAGAVDGVQYAVMFKGSNKSTVWYNVAPFEQAGSSPPRPGTASTRFATRCWPQASRRIRSASTRAGR